MSLREPRRAQAPPVRLQQAAQDIDEGKNARAFAESEKVFKNSVQKVRKLFENRRRRRAETLLTSFVCLLLIRISLCLF